MNIKINREKLTPQQKARLEEAESNANLNADSKSRNQEIVSKIRDNDISLSEELAIHRKALRIILTRLGINDGEFEEYDALVERIKSETLTN
jgi:hypothetical protein